MDLKDAKKYLKRGDLRKVAKKLQLSHTTISNVMNLRCRNYLVETTLLEVAKQRKENCEQVAREFQIDEIN